ncbi:MAG TPA: molybdopterin-binding protein [Gammaproteobacteria bacterium]|nr:molybdopterin-binding protein [Gammaproteobacteria bacterium]
MKLIQCPVGEAAGAILAHSVKGAAFTLKKGHLLAPEDIERLKRAGCTSLTVARTDPGDVGENVAAARLAEILKGPNIHRDEAFTGRCNLKSTTHGLLVAERRSIDQINLIHEAVTLATLEPLTAVQPGQLVATVKIIPFAVPGEILAVCEREAAAAAPVLKIAPFQPKRAGFIQTILPGIQDSMLNKTTRVLRRRLDAVQASLEMELHCPHDETELERALRQLLDLDLDLIIVVGASAVIDRNDVIPAAITRSGGEILHFGMPVDPGNLLLLGRHGRRPVLGMPGCARSPSQNGFDWVLERLAAGLPLTARDIMLLGSGGLLKEIGTRPQPRLGDSEPLT